MRVTDLTKHTAVVSNMNNNSEDLQRLMTNLSSGKRINKPSDDPLGAVATQDYRTSINHLETIQKNIGADKVWLDTAETAIKQMVDILNQAKTNSLQGANGTVSKESRAILANELDSFMNDLVNLANSKSGKLFLFSGTKTLTKPLLQQDKFLRVTPEYTGTRLKSTRLVKPIEEEQIPKGLQAGTLSILLMKGDETVEEINVKLNGQESFSELIDVINFYSSEKQNFVEDKNSPSGFKASIFSQIGADYNIYIDPKPGFYIKFAGDTTNILNILKFGVVGKQDGTNLELPQLDVPAIPDGAFNSYFEGYSEHEYKVRIISPGSFGTAKYIVSDNGGKSWSSPQLFKNSIEVYNPDEKSSSKVFLKFQGQARPYFMEGLEFNFEGNPIVKYMGNEQTKEIMVDNQILVPMNINAKDLFFFKDGQENSVNVIDGLQRLKQNMLADDQDNIIKGVQDIEFAIEQVLKQRAKVGIIMKQLFSSEKRIDDVVFSKIEELSRIEDLDFPKAITELNTAELKHKASLDATSRLIQPSLIQFLR